MTTAERAGTVAGLLDFLGGTASSSDLNRTTVQALKSSWQSVVTELALQPTDEVDALEVDVLMNDFERRRDGFRSGATYRTRLRAGKALYQAWLTGDPKWSSAARTRGAPPDISLNMMQTRRESPVDVVFPVRPDVWIKVEIPPNLTHEEAERIASLYRSFVIPGDAHAGQKEAPAT